MIEAKTIVNGRPLATDNISSPHSLEPLTPNHLLIMKSKVVLLPPGTFQSSDQFSRKKDSEGFSILQMNFRIGGK